MKRIAVSAGVLVALLVVAGFAVGGVGATAQADDAENETPLGAEISSFMQANSAEAEGEVDDGMFNAALNRTEDPEERRQLIEQRQQRLQERQQRLQERRSEITPGNGADVRDHALATHVEVGADRLERSANGTERAAQSAGLNTEALDEIRTSARELRGPEVAAFARNITNSSSVGQQGPPDHAGDGDGSDSDVAANRSSSRGPPSDPANESRDGSNDQPDNPGDPGPPDDREGQEADRTT